MSQSEKRIATLSVTCPHCNTDFDIHITIPRVAKAERQIGSTEVLNLFPEELRSMLRVEDAGDRFIIKPTRWLGKDRFNMAMTVIRRKNGEYIPAGKDSHFTIPKA
ncbi:MAG: hypothetical protein QXL25_03325 [Candidatus Bathyarchaeia archaeon]|nr:hypothetical protein [Candidatus Bathyarchaeota archaeon]